VLDGTTAVAGPFCLSSLAEFFWAMAFEQENQQDIRIFPDVANQLPALMHRLLNTLVGAPQSLVFEAVCAGFISGISFCGGIPGQPASSRMPERRLIPTRAAAAAALIPSARAAKKAALFSGVRLIRVTSHPSCTA
jgi:hypothetical protein